MLAAQSTPRSFSSLSAGSEPPPPAGQDWTVKMSMKTKKICKKKNRVERGGIEKFSVSHDIFPQET